MLMSGMGGSMQDIIIDRLLDDHRDGRRSAYAPSGLQNPARRASSEPWLDALLDTSVPQYDEQQDDQYAMAQASTNAAQPTRRLHRHGSVSQDSMSGMPQVTHGRLLHRNSTASSSMMAVPAPRWDQQIPSSVTGLLDADVPRATADGMEHVLRRSKNVSGVHGTSSIGLAELLRAAGVTRDDGVSNDVVDDVVDDDYTLPDTPTGAGAVRTKVRPTHVLGGYDMMGGVWDEILQGLVVFCVSILPLALITILAQNVIGRLCTSPSCIAFPISAVALSLAGARFTKVLHCDLWDRLTTPDALPAERNGR